MMVELSISDMAKDDMNLHPIPIKQINMKRISDNIATVTALVLIYTVRSYRLQESSFKNSFHESITDRILTIGKSGHRFLEGWNVINVQK